MKEQDLVDLGFDRIDISAEESGDEAYRYYDYMFNEDFSLISCASNEVAVDGGSWFVEMFNHWDIRFYDKEDVKSLIKIINRNKI